MDMDFTNPGRRAFLQAAALMSGGAALLPGAEPRPRGKLHVACNAYTWHSYYARENRKFDEDLDAGLGEVARSGMDGFEPSVQNSAGIDRLVPLLKEHRLELRSIYVSGTLHRPEAVEPSLRNILEIAERARQAGTRIIVINPSTAGPTAPQGKVDDELRRQSDALNRLGAKLRALDVKLAYHNHDAELRNAAREFHHVMLGTEPANLSFCFDCHWIYRGSGNSSVAVFDIMKLYGKRVIELHLRQSVGDVWSETFGDGDIDYRAVFSGLRAVGVDPHLVLEQAPEKGTPKTLSPLEAHRRSRSYVDTTWPRNGA